MITLTFRRPQAFDEDERMKLERAAALCPIMANIDADTEVPATFEYGVVATL